MKNPWRTWPLPVQWITWRGSVQMPVKLVTSCSMPLSARVSRTAASASDSPGPRRWPDTEAMLRRLVTAPGSSPGLIVSCGRFLPASIGPLVQCKANPRIYRK